MKSYLYSDLYELEEKHWWHISKRELIIRFVNKFLRKKRAKILDIGCGTGKNLEALGNFGNVWGIDKSSDALSFCRKKRRLKNVRLAGAEKTGFVKESFDLVTMLDVLEHTDDLKTLVEAKRILSDNSLLVITVPAYQFLWSKWDEVLEHKRRYTRKALIRLLENQGFQILASSYFYSFLILPVFVIRKIKSRNSKKVYRSDFKVSAPLFDKILLMIARLEHIICVNFGMPFGLSLIVVAKKARR